MVEGIDGLVVGVGGVEVSTDIFCCFVTYSLSKSVIVVAILFAFVAITGQSSPSSGCSLIVHQALVASIFSSRLLA